MVLPYRTIQHQCKMKHVISTTTMFWPRHLFAMQSWPSTTKKCIKIRSCSNGEKSKTENTLNREAICKGIRWNDFWDIALTTNNVMAIYWNCATKYMLCLPTFLIFAIICLWIVRPLPRLHFLTPFAPQSSTLSNTLCSSYL